MPFFATLEVSASTALKPRTYCVFPCLTQDCFKIYIYVSFIYIPSMVKLLVMSESFIDSDYTIKICCSSPRIVSLNFIYMLIVKKSLAANVKIFS